MTSVSPSILSADFANMGEECKRLETFGADYIHCDVMDGSFVNQITFGQKMVAAVKRNTSLPLDVHLMIVEPQRHIESFCDAGSSIVTLHYEAVKNSVKRKPGTDIREIEEYFCLLDLVLIMSVEPGKGGQSFMYNSLDKIRYCKNYKDVNSTDMLIEVDGGINDKTGRRCVDAGADILVAGSYVFNGKDMKEAIASLKKL